MKVIIKKTSPVSTWYTKYSEAIFEVKSESEEFYVVIEGKYKDGFILKTDCQIIQENKEIRILKDFKVRLSEVISEAEKINLIALDKMKEIEKEIKIEITERIKQLS
jgi:hypothetical protein